MVVEDVGSWVRAGFVVSWGWAAGLWVLQKPGQVQSQSVIWDLKSPPKPGVIQTLEQG